MVNHLDTTFAALSDPTRRAILLRLIENETLTIKELAEPFAMSLVAVSKHIQVLERAELVIRTKSGRDNFLCLNPLPLQAVRDWLGFYETYWHQRFDALESALAQKPRGKKAPRAVLKQTSPKKQSGTRHERSHKSRQGNNK
jgi:DNA-binding transcriptional ArsR family regulator